VERHKLSQKKQTSLEKIRTARLIEQRVELEKPPQKKPPLTLKPGDEHLTLDDQGRNAETEQKHSMIGAVKQVKQEPEYLKALHDGCPSGVILKRQPLFSDSLRLRRRQTQDLCSKTSISPDSSMPIIVEFTFHQDYFAC